MTSGGTLAKALCALAGALALGAGHAAAAQEHAPGPSGPPAPPAAQQRRTVYPPEFFARYSPATALDMVRRVPGFAIDGGNGDVRGFAGAAGNVVFDGARASSKAEGVEALLARIPARRVVRVEVAPGDEFGSDFAGRSQVLNLVTSREGGVDGYVKLSGSRLSTGRLWGNAEGSVQIRTGGSTFTLAAATGTMRQIEAGFDDIRALPGGARIEHRDKVNDFVERTPRFSASWAAERDSAHTAHVNLSYSPGSFALLQTNHVVPALGPVRDDRLVQDYHPVKYEVGFDVTRPAAGGAIRLVALANRRERDDFDASYNRLGAVTIGGFEQSTKSRYDEVLGRFGWTHPKVLGFAFEIGSELSFNRLDNATVLDAIGADGGRTRIDLPVDQARVEELRAESFVNLGRQLVPRLRLDASLAYEASRLEVSGDTAARRSLRFVKPGLTLDWKHPGGWHAQLSVKRTVDQLDFYDFISSAELAASRINAGNAQLQPQRTWAARLTVERAFWASGLATLDLGYDWASSIKDRVLTPDGFDALGNIGSGRRGYARLALDAPLDRLGLKAVRVKLDGTVQRHRVRDPLNGLSRQWSDRTRWKWVAELRRDLSHWSYGARFDDGSGTTIYRVDETDTSFNTRASASAFAEYRPDRRTTFRLDLDNILDGAGERLRLFFTPDRRTPAPSIEEFRHRDTHIAVTLSVNRTFGGSR